MNMDEEHNHIIIAAHGAGDSSQTYGAISKEIKQFANLVCFDFYGHGKNTQNDVLQNKKQYIDLNYQKVFSIQSLYYQIFEVLLHIVTKLPQKSILLMGHSMGGCAAFEKLDNELMIGLRKCSFKVNAIDNSGHYIQEDNPYLCAYEIFSFIYHNKIPGDIEEIKKQQQCIEQFDICSENGSSSGETRITRNWIPEGIVYKQFQRKTIDIVQQLEKETNKQFYFEVGGLYFGPQNFIEQQTKTFEKQSDFQCLTKQDLKYNYPDLKLPSNFSGIYEKKAGYLLSEQIIQNLLEVSQKDENIQIKINEQFLKFKEDCEQNLILVETNKAGMWVTQILQDLKLPFILQKNQLLWMNWCNERLSQFPIFAGLIQDKFIYGFPTLQNGLKISLHGHGNKYQHVKQINYDIDKEALQILIEIGRNIFNKPSLKDFNLQSDILKVKTCFYTELPDSNFLIDFHPNYKNQNVIIVSACSGHGFKHSLGIGQYIVDLLLKEQKLIPEFSIKRFQIQQKL
ncbi:hypothetical protein PPERSA_00430 [Pseudocohnilembus persalinus]|uniref:Uncharacterized protein n=1 Tax=Pseudocohnilembus persalinus TaxID=266149 RepID=A0A0V0Q9D4_PSEPJ|nr:hypothetical protein PPERSA_00430 [Pseudocohnilembus persalinus]|eukprot:KRW98841.1 hypothetical protein PPERSA_00430 [Pseudocohnilembus persalinus]